MTKKELREKRDWFLKTNHVLIKDVEDNFDRLWYSIEHDLNADEQLKMIYRMFCFEENCTEELFGINNIRLGIEIKQINTKIKKLWKQRSL